VAIKQTIFCSIWLLIFGFYSISLGVQCDTCHLAELGTYLHSPYSSHQCAECHGDNSSFSVSSKKQVDLLGVKWFDKGILEKGTSFILVPRKIKNKTLVFQVQKLNYIILLSPEKTKPLSYLSKDLEIDYLKTCGIQNDIWWEAKICVQLNQPAEIEINCGNLYEYHDHLSSFHQITLAGLIKNKKYKCQIRARNIEGKEIKKEFSFRVVPQKVANFPVGKKVKVELYRLNTQEFLISIVTDGLISWRLGELPYKSKIMSNRDHPLMFSPIKTSVDVCYRCHPEQKIGVSHPVKIPLKKGMKKTDLPLESGLVTCVSCHEPHAANLPYLLRKENTFLCLSCHDERYYK